MHRAAVLAEGVLASKALISRYFAGFDNTNHTRQATNLPNHFAWSLGHLAYIMNRCAEKLDGVTTLPTEDFITAGHASGGGDPNRFAHESVAFASRPVPDPSQYPTAERCVAILNAAADRLSRAVRAAPEPRLDEVVKWGAGEMPLYQLVLRMLGHNGMHCGQIADLRRAFNLKSIFA